MLHAARIDYDLKNRIMQAARQNPQPVCFLAQLHMLPVPPALYGAILELYSAR